MIKKSIYLFVVIFFAPNIIKSQEVNVLLKDYILLEYITSLPYNYTRYTIRAKNQDLWFDFTFRKTDNNDSNYILNEYIEIDSSLAFIPHSSIYVCIYKDDKIMRFRCDGLSVYKILGNRVYVFSNGNWNLDADFKLLPTPNKNCYEREMSMGRKKGLIILPVKEELILKKISYNEYGQKVFSFVKCLPTSQYSTTYKYIQDLGCVEMMDGDSGIIWKLNKIGNVSDFWW